MRQEIYRDRYGFDDWDLERRARCFVHIANSVTWRVITGDEPPTKPVTAEQYREAGVPWFDYCAEGEAAVDGSGLLRKLKRRIRPRQGEGRIAPAGQRVGDGRLGRGAAEGTQGGAGEGGAVLKGARATSKFLDFEVPTWYLIPLPRAVLHAGLVAFS
jgi:hypothetical protein